VKSTGPQNTGFSWREIDAILITMKGAKGEPPQLRILVAGDKSHCGKSTISLGLLASLLDNGFSPSDLAYIKPATQCVSATLTAKFCETAGIEYVHIGPIVFYRGFTRECLDGKHGTPEQRVDACARAVDRIGKGKRIVVIDGVGYPTVGSIVGCSSVDIALACRARVLLVGKSGVGDAIDSFNLCAAVFEQKGIPLLGGIFNKLALTGQARGRACGVGQRARGHTREWARLVKPEAVSPCQVCRQARTLCAGAPSDGTAALATHPVWPGAFGHLLSPALASPPRYASCSHSFHPRPPSLARRLFDGQVQRVHPQVLCRAQIRAARVRTAARRRFARGNRGRGGMRLLVQAPKP
jgi:dethiobiotin synthetase